MHVEKSANIMRAVASISWMLLLACPAIIASELGLKEDSQHWSDVSLGTSTPKTLTRETSTNSEEKDPITEIGLLDGALLRANNDDLANLSENRSSGSLLHRADIDDTFLDLDTVEESKRENFERDLVNLIPAMGTSEELLESDDEKMQNPLHDDNPDYSDINSLANNSSSTSSMFLSFFDDSSQDSDMVNLESGLPESAPTPNWTETLQFCREVFMQLIHLYTIIAAVSVIALLIIFFAL